MIEQEEYFFRKTCKDFYDTFSTDSGKEVLFYLEDFLKRPLVDHDFCTNKMLIREGENNMIRRIFNCIERHKNMLNKSEEIAVNE